MEEEWEESATVLKRHIPTEPMEIDLPASEEGSSRYRWLHVVGYLGIFYFIIMAIIYILIEYALIEKSYQVSLTCWGKIENINYQDLIFVQLASRCPPNQINTPLDIEAILLTNSTDNISLPITIEEEPNAYPYYRNLWAISRINLIYSYNITIKFSKTIPPPFVRDLTVILRQHGLFEQDQTINQAIICLVFASCVAFFNVSSKLIESDEKRKPPKKEEKNQLHKIFAETPDDIQEIDENLENIREIAYSWLVKGHKKSVQFSESDSEYSFLSS